MTQEELEKKLTELETQLQEAVTKADRLEAINAAYQELGTEDRDAFATLSKEDQEKYVDAATDEREAMLAKAHKEIEKQQAADEEPEVPEVVQKQLDEISKRAEAAEAQNKELQERIAKAEDDRRLTELTKVADDEYGNLPGTAEEKAAVLKSLDSLDEEPRGAVLKLFQAGNAALAQLGKPVSKGELETGDGSAMSVIEKKAEAVAKEKSISIELAMDEVFKAEPELYTKYLEEQQ
jgi:hypothetical protein